MPGSGGGGCFGWRPPGWQNDVGESDGRSRSRSRDRGKSGLRRAGCWLTASRGDPQESATESRPPPATRRRQGGNGAVRAHQRPGDRSAWQTPPGARPNRGRTGRHATGGDRPGRVPWWAARGRRQRRSQMDDRLAAQRGQTEAGLQPGSPDPLSTVSRSAMDLSDNPLVSPAVRITILLRLVSEGFEEAFASRPDWLELPGVDLAELRQAVGDERVAQLTRSIGLREGEAYQAGGPPGTVALSEAAHKGVLALMGRPLLDLACDALVKAGAPQVVVNLHHGAEAIGAHLDGRPDVLAVHEPVLLGTGGGLVGARRAGLLGAAGDDHPIVVVTCADHVVDPADLSMLAAALEHSSAPMAIGLDRGRARPTFRLDGELAVAHAAGEWTAAGVFALRPRILDDAPAGYSTMVDTLLEPCWRRGELLGVPVRGAWADAGTLGRFLAVSEGLLAGRWPYPLPPGSLQRDACGGPVFVAAGARLDPRAVVAGPLVLDSGASVGPAAVLPAGIG